MEVKLDGTLGSSSGTKKNGRRNGKKGFSS